MGQPQKRKKRRKPQTNRKNKDSLSSPEESTAKLRKKDINMDLPGTSDKTTDAAVDETSPVSEMASPELCRSTQCKLHFETILETIHGEMSELRSAYENLERCIDNLKTDLNQKLTSMNKEMNKKLAEIGNLRQENLELKAKVRVQERRIDDIDQYSRRQNILFDSIPEKASENTTELVMGQCQKLGITLQRSDIQVTHRLGRPKGDKPRPIIARFTSVGQARQIMQTTKQQFKRDQLATGAGPRNQQKVHTREHLTDFRAKLLQRCITLKKADTIQSCWVYNFQVYAKRLKTDQKGVLIACESDIEALL